MENKVICLAGDKCEYSDICNHGGAHEYNEGCDVSCEYGFKCVPVEEVKDGK